MMGIASLEKIQVLDLSHNCIELIEGISQLAKLVSLNLSCNRIAHITPLVSNSALEVLELSGNSISDSAALLSTLKCMRGLKCLYLKDNPCCIERESLIQLLPCVSYIDDLPVSDIERARWGGALLTYGS